MAVASKLARALSSGGKLVLAFRPDGDDIPARFRDPTYRFPRIEMVTAALERAGVTVGAPMPTAAGASSFSLQRRSELATNGLCIRRGTVRMHESVPTLE